ncbi:cytochrome b5-like heme/steroid binding domain-containing protein [Cantharellus anzutake]|uniref:cytochrome b5-like heme/steroid binding domain-containing protein n=1 Tax=Cantharellus anzutake TaxID=1750568 RepID=UPI001906BB19|nr:cytochrome b5-like heme/steroid binding domain-containing protein [Cantharellus anzutake]KAF8340740.1 cytochrome b5-like heme/steroid binding domain-containing protein [Cantharellus anzutake]
MLFPASKMTDPPTKFISLKTLKIHSTRESLYVVISGKVYDATQFLDEHPGGDEVILAEAGKDATEAFEDVGHSDEARDLLKGLYVGDFDNWGPVCGRLEEGPAKSPTNANLFLFLIALFGIILAYRYYLT